jgi:hypothetical protein
MTKEKNYLHYADNWHVKVHNHSSLKHHVDLPFLIEMESILFPETHPTFILAVPRKP